MMVQHGATEVPICELVRESVVSWCIKQHEEISETCIRLEEFNSSAARNAKSALGLISRLGNFKDRKDQDLLTALKKYVEDTCEAIKVVDSTLKDRGVKLQNLLFEIPDATCDGDMSWRNLVGRRDVIAHQLLTVDDERVYQEAVRDLACCTSSYLKSILFLLRPT